MGSNCVTSKKQGGVKYMDVPRCAPNSYPKNPDYVNSPYSGAPPPVIAAPGAGQSNMNTGDIMLAGAAMHHYGMGIPGPEVYNPMSGGYHAL